MKIFVPGIPRPQGSKAFKGVHGGKPVMVEASKYLDGWRETIRWVVGTKYRGELLTGPIEVRLEFIFPVPKTHKEWKPHTVTPDIDKLSRACLDSLTKTVYRDDAQVTLLCSQKRYAHPGEEPGVWITWQVDVSNTDGVGPGSTYPLGP